MFSKITTFAFIAAATVMSSSIAQAGCKTVYYGW